MSKNKIMINSNLTYFNGTLMFSRLSSGKYSLSVMFDSLVTEKCDFEILLTYEKTIPLLLNSLAAPKKIKDSELGFFYSLTGYPSWGRYYFDIDTLTTEQVLPQLTEWWKRNGETVKLVEEQLNSNENKNLDYNKRIPELIKIIEEGPFPERLVARNQFYSIAKIPLWIPRQDDQANTIANEVDNLKRWWAENKDVINWVSRVISENSQN